MSKWLLDAISNRAWLMDEAGLDIITNIADRAGEDPVALADRLGRPLENSHKTEVIGHTAVIPISGPMFPKANLFTEISGATSTEQVAQDFRQAMDDPSVHAIVMDINSPGGSVDGINELAKMIYQARGIKPITAYVGHMAASAAYWIASAADQIVMDDTAIVGSIGVVTQHVKRSDPPGTTKLEIVSSQSPNKRLDPSTDTGKAAVQATVDALAQVFIDAVAQNRGVSAKKVMDNFGQGGVFVGADAVRRGMADCIGTRSDAITGTGRMGSRFMAAENATEDNMSVNTNPVPVTAPLTAALVAAEHPSIAQAFRDEGVALGKAEMTAAVALARTEAAVAERARITAIHEMVLPGYEAVAEDAIASGKAPADFAVSQVKAMKAHGNKMVAALAADEIKVAVVSSVPAPEAVSKPVVNPNLPLEARTAAVWENDPAIRAEFGTLAIYHAYMKANEAGRVRVLKNRNSES